MKKESLPNPFKSTIVTSLQENLPTTESLHRAAFIELVGIFEDLENQPLPRTTKEPKIQVLLSRQPGSGKSHLLGRLWKTIRSRAIVLYLQYQDDPDGHWLRMLRTLRQELDFPDKEYEIKFQQPGMTPLDDLARGILIPLLTEGIETKQIRANTTIIEALRENRENVLTRMGEQLPSIITETRLTQIVAIWNQQLIKHGIRLNRLANAWIRALACYTLKPPGHEARTTALAWLQGGDLDANELRSIGLGTNEAGEGTNSNSPKRFRNIQALDILRDWCFIASFHKPIVFAFDQPETFMDNPEAAKAFRNMLTEMRDNFCGKLIIVAANEVHWFNKIEPHFKETSHIDRVDIARYDRLKLRGIVQPQARELVRDKLLSAGYTETVIEEFLLLPWLQSLFKDNTVNPSPREVQKKASEALELWLHGKSHTISVEEYLTTAYEAHCTRLLQSAKETAFDADKLQWIFTHGFSGLAGAQVNLEFKSERGYLDACWRVEPETRYFVFDDSTNWMRWRAIVSEYNAYRSKGNSVHGFAVWPTGLGKFSSGVNTLLDAAKSSRFHLLVLNDEDMAELYAGYALHADVSNGNITQANQADLLRFLGKRWQSWAERLKNAKKESIGSEDSPAIPKKVESPTFSADVLVEIISAQKTLAWSVLQIRLQERGLSPTIEQVLQASDSIPDKIFVLSAPNNHLFQWKS